MRFINLYFFIEPVNCEIIAEGTLGKDFLKSKLNGI